MSPASAAARAVRQLHTPHLEESSHLQVKQRSEAGLRIYLPAKNKMEDSLQNRSRGRGLPSCCLMRCRNAEIDWSSAAGLPLSMHIPCISTLLCSHDEQTTESSLGRPIPEQI